MTTIVHVHDCHSQRRRLYVVVGPDPSRPNGVTTTGGFRDHTSLIPPFHFSSIVFPIIARLNPFEWTSDYVFNVYFSFPAAPPPFANTCHSSHFSQMFEDVRAELKRQ